MMSDDRCAVYLCPWSILEHNCGRSSSQFLCFVTLNMSINIDRHAPWVQWAQNMFYQFQRVEHQKKKNVCEIILKAVKYCGDQNKLQESRRKKRTRNFQERTSNFSLDVYINILQSFCELYTLCQFLTIALWGDVVVLIPVSQMRKLRLREIQEKSCAKSDSQLGI